MTTALSTTDTRPPTQPCPVVDLTPTCGSEPFTLTAACGWTTTVAQGTPWADHPARRRWLTHQCRDGGAR